MKYFSIRGWFHRHGKRRACSKCKQISLEQRVRGRRRQWRVVNVCIIPYCWWFMNGKMAEFYANLFKCIFSSLFAGFFARFNAVRRHWEWRSCIIGANLEVKVCTLGTVINRTAYPADYCQLEGTGRQSQPMPIRWMSWESVLLVSWTQQIRSSLSFAFPIRNMKKCRLHMGIDHV